MDCATFACKNWLIRPSPRWLSEGDLRETLKRIGGPVDFMLADVWIVMAQPALELVAPQLKPGAIVVCDNTEQYRSAYADYFRLSQKP